MAKVIRCLDATINLLFYLLFANNPYHKLYQQKGSHYDLLVEQSITGKVPI